eukprot:TRINITY_DN13092_c0_g1_i1.p1 TRINITY_DN13092_c0_g1~~TRINITY_DN13092_c0_g1_i1.p1  ORF type:complete len:1313 (+),score=203.21 TRINITY_DN13092_c0_g1_i1:114-3941(+)
MALPVRVSKRQRTQPPPPSLLLHTSPHAREHCTQHVFWAPINDASHLRNVRHCPQCFCFVCDRPVARCVAWPLHCMALYAEPLWRQLRADTRAGRNVLPVPPCLLPPRAKNNFSMRRYIQNTTSEQIDKVELIDLVTDAEDNTHNEHSRQNASHHAPQPKPVGAPVSVAVPDDDPISPLSPESLVPADQSSHSDSPSYPSSPSSAHHSPASPSSASNTPCSSMVTPQSPPPSSPLYATPSPTLSPPHPSDPSFLWEALGDLPHQPSSAFAAGPSSKSKTEPSLSNLFTNASSDPALKQLKSLWQLDAPLQMRPCKNNKRRLSAAAAAKQAKQPKSPSVPDSVNARMLIGHIDLWRPYCSHLSASHIEQTLGHGESDVSSLLSQCDAHIAGCTSMQVETIVREMGLDLESHELHDPMSTAMLLGDEDGTLSQELAQLPNYAFADKKPIPPEVLTSLTHAMRSGQVEGLWSISHHDVYDNEHKALSQDVGVFSASFGFRTTSTLLLEQRQWLCKRRSVVQQLKHLDCSNCCRLRLSVYVTPKAFSSVFVNAARFCHEKLSPYSIMTPVDGGLPLQPPSQKQLHRHRLSFAMTLPNDGFGLRDVFSILQPVVTDGTQASSSTACAPVGSVLDTKLYNCDSKTFKSISLTYRNRDSELRNRAEDIWDELKEICKEQNQDVSANVMPQALLRSSRFTVSDGYKRVEPQPTNVKLELRLYQRESLAWMIDREKEQSVSAPFWIRICAKDLNNENHCLYYCPLTGSLSNIEPPPVVGGVLAEEMGLGKTIIVISLIDATIEQARQWRRLSPSGRRSDLINSGVTLVVCPVSLLKQWEQECKTRLHRPLRVLTWYGVRTKVPSTIASYDVVLTTYGVLACHHHDALTKINWYRVVIDESTYLRGGANNCAHVLNEELVSCRRWAVSGTPFGNQLSSFRGTMRFLGVLPFSSSRDFDYITCPFTKTRSIFPPITDNQILILPQLAYVLKNLMMRHVKDQEFRGSTLIELPPASGRLVRVKSEFSEKRTYKTVEEKMQSFAFPGLKDDRQFRGQVLALLQMLMPVRMIADGIVPEPRVFEQGSTRRVFGYHAKAASEQLPGGIQNAAKIKQLIQDVTTYRTSDECNKFVIFSEFRDVQVAIKVALERAGHRTLTLEGSMSAVKRGKIIRQFAEDIEVVAMVFSMRLGACGLTLTMANVVVLFEVGVDYALEMQAVNRIHRIGQTRSVETLTYVTEGTVDERIMTVRRKRGLPRYFGDGEKIKKETAGKSFSKLEEMRILYDWSPQ